jgi:hypothetical protein
LPPPGNFPAIYSKGSKKEMEVLRRKEKEAMRRNEKEAARRKEQEAARRQEQEARKPARKASLPRPYTPLQSLLSPLRSMFGGGSRREERPVVRRQEEARPAPLPPPNHFPKFESAPGGNDVSSGSPRRRRRKKRPRRPLAELGSRPEEEEELFPWGGRRREEGRPRRPLYRKPARRYRDQLYSPSETEDTVVEAVEAPAVTYVPATNLGLGVFNPRAIISESGFLPVVPSQGNTPSLAFSIFDPDSDGQGGQGIMDRMDTFTGPTGTTGDRGTVLVDIPGRDILPYVARRPVERRLQLAMEQGRLPGDPWQELIQRNTGSGLMAMESREEAAGAGQSSADFHSFQTVAGQEDGLKVRRVHDVRLGPGQADSDSPLLLSVGSSLTYGPPQPSRPGSVAVGSVGRADYVHRQMLTAPDGTSLAYGNQADYGKQHPSFVQQEVQTRLGNSATKQLDTSDDVVYGKVAAGSILRTHTDRPGGRKPVGPPGPAGGRRLPPAGEAGAAGGGRHPGRRLRPLVHHEAERGLGQAQATACNACAKNRILAARACTVQPAPLDRPINSLPSSAG